MEQYGMDGSYKKKKGDKTPKNFILDAIEKRLLRKDNVAPAAKFIQRQRRLKDTLKKLNEE
tara:strand:+ start:554 stop:736 length:183 start_codon:yes stop_codon:yes gene_type:complete